MSTLEGIEAAIETLPPEDFKKLRKWLSKHEAEAWDRQIEKDARGGRLDKLADQALAELKNGQADRSRDACDPWCIPGLVSTTTGARPTTRTQELSTAARRPEPPIAAV